jgi:hypothetical protein
VILYALAAVLLWPTDRPAAFPAAGRVGERAARIGWLVLWGLLAWVMLWRGNRAPDAVHDVIAAGGTGGPGNPRWLVWLDDHAADLVAGRGLGVAIGLAAVFALIAVSVWLPWRRAVQAGLVAAIAVSAAIWVLGEGLGMPFQGAATDPNSGPLLALLALGYWPSRAAATALEAAA